MCCDSAPAPDYSGVAASNEASAKYAKEAADNDLAFRKQVYGDNLPRVQQLFDLASQVANQQLGIADENQIFARQQQNLYRDSFMPNELQTIADAYGSGYLNDSDRAQLNQLITGSGGLNTADRMSAMQGLSQTAVNNAGTQAATRASADINSTYGQAYRTLTRLGGDPNRLAAQAAQIANSQALARVGATNNAREAARGQLMGLRTGVANFGRNMPNTAGQAFGLATQAGSSATANQGAAANAALPYAQFQAGGYGTQLGAGSLGVQSALGYGGLLSRDYATAANNSGGTMGALLGLGSLGVQAYGAGMFSDRRLKTNIVRVGTLKGGIDIYEFDFIWGGPRQRGVMADEVELVMPSAVSIGPGGYKIVDYSKLGVSHGPALDS